jgi:hypothetical protein
MSRGSLSPAKHMLTWPSAFDLPEVVPLSHSLCARSCTYTSYLTSPQSTTSHYQCMHLGRLVRAPLRPDRHCASADDSLDEHAISRASDQHRAMPSKTMHYDGGWQIQPGRDGEETKNKKKKRAAGAILKGQRCKSACDGDPIAMITSCIA